MKYADLRLSSCPLVTYPFTSPGCARSHADIRLIDSTSMHTYPICRSISHLLLMSCLSFSSTSILVLLFPTYRPCVSARFYTTLPPFPLIVPPLPIFHSMLHGLTLDHKSLCTMANIGNLVYSGRSTSTWMSFPRFTEWCFLMS